jgi:hypothetical protein
MKNDYRQELEKVYEETLQFLWDEGWEAPQFDFGGKQREIMGSAYDGPERFLQKDQLLTIFKNL